MCTGKIESSVCLAAHLGQTGVYIDFVETNSI